MKTLATGRVVEELRGRMGSLCEGDMPGWGVMTATEMACHLRGAFELAQGSRLCQPIAGPLPPGVMRTLALWVPVRWPKGVPTVPGLRREELRPEGFAEEKAGLLEAYGSFLGMPGERPRHPILGSMGRGDWMRWGYLHTDHHLRQFGR